MRAGSTGTLGCVLVFFLALSARVNAALSKDLSSKVSKRQTSNKDEISRDGISTETSEREVTTTSPVARSINTDGFLRSGAYAMASSDGASQAVAQATATSGGDNAFNPGVGGTNSQYPQNLQSKGLGYDPSELANYNTQAAASPNQLGNIQAPANIQGIMNPYSLPTNGNIKYPGAGTNLHPNTGLNFVPQLSNAQGQAYGAYPNYPQQQYYPWDLAYNSMSPGYGSAQTAAGSSGQAETVAGGAGQAEAVSGSPTQPQSVAGSPTQVQDVASNPAQAGALTLGQGYYYPYGQLLYPSQPVSYNTVYPGWVPGFTDYGSSQAQPNALSARRNIGYIPALTQEGIDFDNQRLETTPNEAQQNFGASSPLAFPRSAQNIYLRNFAPAYQNPGYNTGSLEPQSDVPVYNGYTPGINVVTQSSLLPDTFGFTTSPANTYSRLVLEEELIYPHKIPGAENSIVCSRNGELHYLWTASHQCQICVCTLDRGQLRPACVRCAGCRGSDSAPPEPTQTISPLIVDLQSSSDTPASCNPLPANKEFQNPLNPCQVCVCRQTNRPDVKITCQESPQCVLPSNVPTIPPMPVPSEPVSLPLCNKLPQNVFFPHPTEACKLCKCFTQRSLLGVPEPRVLCQPNPDCSSFPVHPDKPSLPTGPYPFPTDEVIPQDPHKPEILPYGSGVTGYPTSSEAYPSPEPITDRYALSSLTVPSTSPSSLEPVPWPPNKRGPLPGPPPHDSCRPFPPNTPFDHPWDECQVCVCSEAAGQNRVSVEVSCYTKPSCCIEIPTLGPTKQVVIPTSIPAAASANSPQLHILDKMCEFKSFGVEFRHEADRCRLCSCELIGAYVAPVCRRAPFPECTNQPASISNGQVIYIEPRCRQQLPYQPFAVGCNHCTCQSIFNYVVAKCTTNPLCQSANLEENTSVNGQANAQTQFLSYPGGLVSAPLQPTRLVPYATQQPANGLGPGYANVNSYQKGRLYSSNLDNRGQAGTLSQNTNFYTNSLGGYRAYPSQAEAGALGKATASSSGLYTPSIINSYANRNIYSLGNLGNSGDSLTQSKNSFYFPNSNSYQYTPFNTAQSSVMQVLPTQDVYPSTYSKPGYNLSPLHMGNNWSTSKVTADSNAQSSASAFAVSGDGGGGGGSRCQYEGDMYHHRCQACVCRYNGKGQLYAVCLGEPCYEQGQLREIERR